MATSQNDLIVAINEIINTHNSQNLNYLYFKMTSIADLVKKFSTDDLYKSFNINRQCLFYEIRFGDGDDCVIDDCIDVINEILAKLNEE